MFGLGRKLPVNEEERLWVDEGFRRLELMLGAHRMLDAKMVEPTDEFFPDPYDKSEAGMRVLFKRVCGYMHVDPNRVDLEIIPDSSDAIAELPHYHLRESGPAGLHWGETREDRALIGVKLSLLKDPLPLIATLAHELAHVVLLDDGHTSRDLKDMEPMTDLATVYLGMGIFTANCAFRYRKWQDDRHEGWSVSSHGYLPEVVYGYALARIAQRRGDKQPTWTAHLSTNLKSYFRQSAAWLQRQHPAV